MEKKDSLFIYASPVYIPLSQVGLTQHNYVWWLHNTIYWKKILQYEDNISRPYEWASEVGLLLM